MQNTSDTKASFAHALRISFYQAILIPVIMIATAFSMGASAFFGMGVLSLLRFLPTSFNVEGIVAGALFIPILIACPVGFEIIFMKLIYRSARLVSQKYMISSAKRVAIMSTLMFLLIAPLIQLVFSPLLIPFLGIFVSVFYAVIMTFMSFMPIVLLVHIILFYYFTKFAFRKNSGNKKSFTQIP